MRILITGCSGFIGGALYRYLSETTDCALYTLGRTTLSSDKHFSIKSAEDYSAIKKAIQDVSPHKIFHCAGGSKAKTFPELYQANVIYSTLILDALRELGMRECTVCLFGSAAEYGLLNKTGSALSENVVCRPVSEYGISKYVQTLLLTHSRFSELDVRVYRPFNVIGPEMPKTLFLSQLTDMVISALEAGQKQLKLQSLYSYRDLIDVRDLVKIVWMLSNHKSQHPVINLCQGRPVSMRHVFFYLVSKIYPELDVVMGEEPQIVDKSFGDLTLLRECIGEYDFIDWKKSVDDILKFRMVYE